LNFGVNDTAHGLVHYLWDSPGDHITSQGDSQYCTINFEFVGTHTISVVAKVPGYDCPSSQDTIVIKIDSSASNPPPLIHLDLGARTFMCLDSWVAVVCDDSNSCRSYLWGWDDTALGPHPLKEEINQIFTIKDLKDTLHKNYWVIVVDSAGHCPQKSYYGHGNWPKFIDINENQELSVEVFPNPATDLVNVNLLSGNLIGISIEVFDIMGRFVKGIPFAGSKNAVEISDLAPGIFTIQLKKDGRPLKHLNFIKYNRR
jgi:hypothetical protein